MQTEKIDFGRYGKAFQEGLVQLILKDRSFADQITGLESHQPSPLGDSLCAEVGKMHFYQSLSHELNAIIHSLSA